MTVIDATDIEDRIAELIATGTPFSSNDVLLCGENTFDPAHRPNARNNGIGHFFFTHSKRGHIVLVGVTNSCAPARKRGLIRVWQPTNKGRMWAAGHLGAATVL